ncbi:transposase [Candidatus Omnitrophota bacterium]
MPRGPRILLENACYHIINRGNQKQDIFFDEEDFRYFLKFFKHYKKKYPVKIFGYCLMPNHIHIILQARYSKNLRLFMKGLAQTYTAWFNDKYKKAGHLWQGRFKNMIVHKDEYFLECIRYVETNPVRAGLTASPAEYTWSSYRDRLYGNKNKILDLPDST